MSGPPELPVATVVLALGQFEVTADVATGFVVLHDTLTLQVLPPATIVHAVGDSVSVPVIGATDWVVTLTHDPRCVVPPERVAATRYENVVFEDPPETVRATGVAEVAPVEIVPLVEMTTFVEQLPPR